MRTTGKIIELDQLVDVLEKERKYGKSVVHCHGVYDLMHVGHIKHLEAAKALGDILVVTITQDKYVNKGPTRPAFTASLRAEALAALACVDFVSVNQWPTAVETIHIIKPNIYVKGATPDDGLRDHSKAFDKEKEAIEAVGGKLLLTNEDTYSSSALINQYMSNLPAEARSFIDRIRDYISPSDMVKNIKSIRDLKILVIGEAIIDEYVFCQTMGKANKDPVLATLQLHTDRYAGGALAIANHAANFCDNVTMLSMLGEENSYEAFILSKLAMNIQHRFIMRRDAPTIVKRRFIEEYMSVKLFEVYDMCDKKMNNDDEQAFLDKLDDLVSMHDVVIVADYGHGLMTEKAIEKVCQQAKFLAVNAQTNAGNRGFNPISKYPRADYVCIDEPEARMEMRDREMSERDLIKHIHDRMCCPCVMLTMGKKGSLFLNASGPSNFDVIIEHIPVFGAKVVDRTGAGDAVLAITAPCVAVGMPPIVTGFIGNIVGAEACAIMGNERAVSESSVLRHITHIMK